MKQDIAESIYLALKASGAEIGTASISIIAKELEGHRDASAALKVEVDKNYLIRLKAGIEKRMKGSGVWELIEKGSENYEEFEQTVNKFFASLNDFYPAQKAEPPKPPTP